MNTKGYLHEWNVKYTAYKEEWKSEHGKTTTTIINENTVKKLMINAPFYRVFNNLLKANITEDNKKHYGRFMPLLLSKSGIKF
ncbi:MAG: hypothetical protein ACTSV5_13110 [Promethearchaeota archaeon]